MKGTFGLIAGLVAGLVVGLIAHSSQAYAMSIGLDKSSVTVNAGDTVWFSAGASSSTNSPVSISWTLNNNTSLGTGPSVSFVAQSYMNGAEIEVLATDGNESVNTTAHVYVNSPQQNQPQPQPTDPQSSCSATRNNGREFYSAWLTQNDCRSTCSDMVWDHPAENCTWNGDTDVTDYETCELYGPRGGTLASFQSKLGGCLSRCNAAVANHPNITCAWAGNSLN